MSVVFENEHLIVVDKPAGVLTTPARDPADPRRCLGRELQSQLGQQIYPVHRLDFEVSGLVMFTKTADAHRSAQRWFEHAQVAKLYRGQSLGTPAALAAFVDVQEWQSHIVRGKRRSFVAPHGLLARTRARVVDVKAALWHLEPITGRPHQLRVEMARHGFPLRNDVLYGAPAEPAQVGISLRAVALGFESIKDRLGLPERLLAPDSGLNL